MSTFHGTTDLLSHFHSKGVRFWSEQGQLRYRAPKGALTPEDLDALRAARNGLVALLQTGIPRALPSAQRAAELLAKLERFPLSFSQLAHWNLYKLGERPSFRQLACAFRLQGHLKVDVLCRTIAETIQRHEALRIRIVCHEGTLTQELRKPGPYELQVLDLSKRPVELREAQLQRALETLIIDPIDVARDPLWEIRLVLIGPDEHVLAVAMDHLIGDGISLNILLSDLFGAYTRMLHGLPAFPEPAGLQFSDYVLWQRNLMRSWDTKHGAYWHERFAGRPRTRFPGDPTADKDAVGWATVPLRIGKALKAELIETSRLRRTTPAMCVFSAYIAAVARWCDESDVGVQYESGGRGNSQLQSTIGYLAYPLFLRIELRESDSFIDLMQQVMQEYCAADEHGDFSYMESQLPRPEFARNPAFNWMPQEPRSDLDDSLSRDASITSTPVAFRHPMLQTLDRDNEPMVLLYDTAEEIRGEIYFPLNRFCCATMERFGRDLLLLLGRLLRGPETRVRNVPLGR